MTALLFSLGIILVCVVLIAFTTRHMVNTVMRLYDDLLEDRLENYGIQKGQRHKYKEDDNYKEDEE